MFVCVMQVCVMQVCVLCCVMVCCVRVMHKHTGAIPASRAKTIAAKQTAHHSIASTEQLPARSPHQQQPHTERKRVAQPDAQRQDVAQLQRALNNQDADETNDAGDAGCAVEDSILLQVY